MDNGNKSVSSTSMTRQRYLKRIETAQKFIRKNMSQNITLDKIAKESGFSPYHFHRIFHGITGETPQDYLRRIRLEAAANSLCFKKATPITDIALAHGFSSSSNFSKAFKEHFGYTPSQIRTLNPDIENSKIGILKSKYGKDFHPDHLYPESINYDFQESKMNVTIKDLEEKDIATIASTKGYEEDGIFQAWNQIMTWAMQHADNYESVEKYGFGYDNPTITPLDKCRYDAAVVIGENWIVPKQFKTDKIPKGKYAVLYYKGDNELNASPHLWLLGEWFPNSGYEPDNYPLFERYLNDVRNDGYVEKEIFVKIKE